jgi:hypothetical protein
MTIKRFWPALLLLTACASMERDCSSCNAGTFGSDWIVLQYGYDGTPINCWRLTNTAISNEQHTDGIFWQDPAGNLIHISGWYNRVQVISGNFEGAAKSLGIELNRCSDGKYLSTPPAVKTGYYDYYDDDDWAYASVWTTSPWAPIHGTPGRG